MTGAVIAILAAMAVLLVVSLGASRRRAVDGGTVPRRHWLALPAALLVLLAILLGYFLFVRNGG